MKVIASLLLIVLVCFFSADAQTVRGNRTQVKGFVGTNLVSQLPIRRVILYSNGVAYIERRGLVSGNAQIDLAFKQSQVDDVLKSMVVLDLNDGKIGAVSYNSSAPASARTAEIPFSVQASSNDGGGIAGVLAQLQGAKVAVTSNSGTVVGSILTVERKPVQMTPTSGTTWTSVLVISSDSGEITSFDLSTVRGVRVLDEDTRKDLSEFATATASARRRDAKTISVTSNGQGQREMVVSYTIAAPIWKTTYRVVLEKDGKPFFQGWAIVDNISEENWQNVKLSLVSGSPISFIQNLQKPFYRYRPVVPTPQDLQLRPQVYEPGGSGGTAISGVVTDANGAVVPNADISIQNTSTGETRSLRTDASGNFYQANLKSGMYTVSAQSPGFNQTRVSGVSLGANLAIELQVGSVSSTVDVVASAEMNSVAAGANLNSRMLSSLPMNSRGVQALSNTYMGAQMETSVSQALTSGQSGIVEASVGEEVGDLFQYTIEHPITVMRDRSALIPIIQRKLDGERVAIYNSSVREDRPYSGVLLKNGTDLTFESGSITVLDGDAYAGEALMERLKPKEQRLISFALDLGTHVRVRNSEQRDPTKLIKVVGGSFQAHYFRTEEKTYQLTNQTDRKKVVYIEHPVRSGWILSDTTPKPEYTTQRFYRFRVELGPLQETELKVAERQPLMDSYQLTALSRADLDMFVARNYISGDLKSRLEKLLNLRSALSQTSTRLESLDNEIESITDDQKRFRENIESLSKTPEAKSLITRYITKANEQETRIEQIEKDKKTLAADKERLERELATEIQNFEVK